MAIEIKLPVLAEGVESGDVLNVLVKPGDVIQPDDPIVELESEKATVPVPSPVGGRVKEVLVKAGDKVRVGETLIVLDELSEVAEPPTASAAPPTAESPKKEPQLSQTAPGQEATGAAKPVEIKLPVLAEGVEAGDVLNVLVKVGDLIQPDDPIIELESEKATVPVPTPVGGRVKEILVKPGDKVRVGETLLIVESATDVPRETQPTLKEASDARPAAAAEGESKLEVSISPGPKAVAEPRELPVQPLAPAVTPEEEFIPAGPAVRRIAREIGLDLRRVRGSGKNGRILIEDLDPYIQEYVRKRGGTQGTGTLPVQAPELPDFSQWGPVRRVKADSVRRKIAEHLTQAWLTIPHVHQFHEADVTELLQLQKRHRERVKELGGALTLTPFLMKAVVIALKEFPEFNSSYDARAEEIIYKDYYHLGIAVDTKAGLIVPVVRDVDKKSIVELAIELTQLAQRTRDRKVTIEELRGSTFTISNLGSIGGGHFTPIVNSPEVAILGVGRASKRVVLTESGVAARDYLPLVLGYDHRIIDGAQGARFIVRVAEVLENFEATFLGF